MCSSDLSGLPVECLAPLLGLLEGFFWEPIAGGGVGERRVCVGQPEGKCVAGRLFCEVTVVEAEGDRRWAALGNSLLFMTEHYKVSFKIAASIFASLDGSLKTEAQDDAM